MKCGAMVLLGPGLERCKHIKGHYTYRFKSQCVEVPGIYAPEVHSLLVVDVPKFDKKISDLKTTARVLDLSF